MQDVCEQSSKLYEYVGKSDNIELDVLENSLDCLNHSVKHCQEMWKIIDANRNLDLSNIERRQNIIIENNNYKGEETNKTKNNLILFADDTTYPNYCDIVNNRHLIALALTNIDNISQQININNENIKKHLSEICERLKCLKGKIQNHINIMIDFLSNNSIESV